MSNKTYDIKLDLLTLRDVHPTAPQNIPDGAQLVWNANVNPPRAEWRAPVAVNKQSN